MILENMVPIVKLVLTTLAISNSIGSVLPQDKLGHGIAEDCGSKCIIT